MDSYFGIPVTFLAVGLAAALACVVVAMGLLAWRRPLLFRLGIRNVSRRRTQMILIALGLMLSTMLTTCALATGDTMTATMNVQVLQQVGRTDEIVTVSGADFFPYSTYVALHDAMARDRDIAALVPAINRGNTVVADMTVRQISSGVALLGVPSPYSPVYGSLRDTQGRRVSLDALGSGEVYANAALAQDLDTGPGHKLYVFFDGKRFSMRVRAVLENGDLSGTRPTLLTTLSHMQSLTGQPEQVNRIMVANAGLATQMANRSDTVTAAIEGAAVPAVLSVDEARQDATRMVSRAEDIFTRIFTLFTLFAVAISALLIFLIFSMLASERRGEMGVTRALGAQRGHLIATFLFEGATYDLIAAGLGLGAGLALGWVIVSILASVFARFQVQIGFAMTPESMTLAYCLGALTTLVTVYVSSWWVSHLNVVSAIRDLPDYPSQTDGLWACLRAIGMGVGRLVQPHPHDPSRAVMMGAIFLAILRTILALAVRGLILLPLGMWLAARGIDQVNIGVLSLGVSLIALSSGLLVRWLLQCAARLWSPLGDCADRCGFTLAGLGLLGYWVLPYETLYTWGLPRFDGGIEVFFVAGLMMVTGAVWVVVYNIGVLLRPLGWFVFALGRAALALRTAIAYPLHHRFRTGLALSMFSLVVFTLTVMSVISDASQTTYDNPDAMGNGFAIQAGTIFTPVPHIEQAMARSPYVQPKEFSAIGTQAYDPIGVLQLSAPQPHWTNYLASVVNPGFLKGTEIKLGTRARGYASDRAVWQAVATHPGLAVIDSQALLSQNGYAAQPLVMGSGPTFVLSGVVQEDKTMSPTPVWIAALNGGRAIKVTIIGVIDSQAYQTYGLFISARTLAGAGAPAVTPTNYYFQPRAGLDPEREKRRVESAFLDHGLEATVTNDEILRNDGPRMLVSGMLQGFVGLTLLMGVVALGLIAARSVVERRQQIGMLRALGVRRRTIAAGLLLESGFVGIAGSVIGIVLGLALCKNLFASNFFEQYKSGMIFTVNWEQLVALILIACGASLLTTLVPAWQATRILPAEALRYE